MDVIRFQKANCKDCYKCIRACPVKAIVMHDHHAEVLPNDCVLCGKCVLACPQYAAQSRADLPRAREILAGALPVYAIVDPSFAVQYRANGFEPMRQIIRKLGFADAFEAAEGAAYVHRDYSKIVNERPGQVVISSACPSVVRLVERYFPLLLENLAPTVSPMQAQAKILHKKFGADCSIIAIGPCLAAKSEWDHGADLIDCTITFNELNAMIVAAKQPLDLDAIACKQSPKLSRLFALDGGILLSMERENSCSYLSAAGMENCMHALREIEAGRLHDCFMDLRACEGGCSGGPKISAETRDSMEGRLRINAAALSLGRPAPDYECLQEIDVSRKFASTYKETKKPNAEQMQEILYRLGKHSAADELNCGACGYKTCREKAEAIFLGKADVSMCLPYMKKRAESLSDKIISASPNAIISVDNALTVRFINRAALAMFDLSAQDEIIGKPVSGVMDEFEFVSAFSAGRHTTRTKAYLKNDKVVEQVFVYDKENAIAICIMQDVTEHDHARALLQTTKKEAIEITDKIIEKQMRTVHEIASLLGETAAETQVALTRLKTTVAMEEVEQ